MENRNKVDFDQKKEKKERKRGFGKIDSSIRITKAGRSKPLFQGRFIRTPQRTNIFLSNFSKLASLFQKKFIFPFYYFRIPFTYIHLPIS